MRMTPEDVDSVCGLVLDLCGVYLDETKSYLIESRLGEIADREGCASFGELVDRVRRTVNTTLAQDVVDAITTQETLFFRDSSPFDALQHKALPELIDAKAGTRHPRRLRIWSAACSTGQEPYSIAMTMSDLLPETESWDIQILGTDIADAAIAKASRGEYGKHEVDRGLPARHVRRYFREEGDVWRIDDRIRAMVSFRKLNLHDSFATLGQFDIVFCRNVAIYFTPQARRSLFERMSLNLNEGGYLFVGSSESLLDLGERFTPHHHCRSVFYRPNSRNSQLLEA